MSLIWSHGFKMSLFQHFYFLNVRDNNMVDYSAYDDGKSKIHNDYLIESYPAYNLESIFQHDRITLLGLLLGYTLVSLNTYGEIGELMVGNRLGGKLIL